MINRTQNTDIRTVDVNSLTEITTVVVNTKLPIPERMSDLVYQMGDPDFFRYGDTAVKISYADTPVRFRERLESYLRTI